MWLDWLVVVLLSAGVVGLAVSVLRGPRWLSALLAVLIVIAGVAWVAAPRRR